MKLNDRDSVFLEKPRALHEVFFIRINKKVGGKRSTLGTHRNADCLLKNTSTKHKQYAINKKKLGPFDDFSFRELFIGIRYLIRVLKSTWEFFFMEQSGTNSVKLVF